MATLQELLQEKQRRQSASTTALPAVSSSTIQQKPTTVLPQAVAPVTALASNPKLQALLDEKKKRERDTYAASSPYQRTLPTTGEKNVLTSPILPFQKDDTALKIAGKAAVNLPTSAVRTTEGLTEMGLNVLNTDPEKNTLNTLIKAGVGGFARAGEAISNLAQKNLTFGQNVQDQENAKIATDQARRVLDIAIQEQDPIKKQKLIDISKEYNQQGVTISQRGRATQTTDLPKFEQTKELDIADAIGKAITDRYGSWENTKRSITEDPFGVVFDLSILLQSGGSLLTKVAATGKARALVQFAKEGATADEWLNAARSVNPTAEFGKIVTKTGEVIDPFRQATKLPGAIKDIFNSVAETNKVKSAKELSTLAQKVGQGAEEGRQATLSALSEIDTVGVKTSKDLVSAYNGKITGISEGLDTMLATNGNQYSKAVIDARGHNYIEDGLKQLLDHYNKTNDIRKAGSISALANKANTTGLTVQEMNELAKELNVELSKFKANGDLASSNAAEMFENTRKGVKAQARDLFDNPLYGEADLKLSDLFDAKKMAEKRVEAFNKAEGKIKEMTIADRTRQLAIKALDLASGGAINALRSYFIKNGKAGSMNALELEKSLAKDLAKIQDILDSGANEQTIVNRLQAEIDRLNDVRISTPKLPPAADIGTPNNPIITPRPGEGSSQTPSYNPRASEQNAANINAQAVKNTLQQELTGMTERFKSKETWLNFANSNPALLKKIESAGTTPEGLWDINKANVKKPVSFPKSQQKNTTLPIRISDGSMSIRATDADMKAMSIPPAKTTSASQAIAKGQSFEEFVKGQGTPLYHGTQAKEFTEFKGITYLTKDVKEAQGFADGVHLGGGRGGKPRTIEVTTPLKKIKDIDDGMVDAMMDGDLDIYIEKQLSIAKKDGYDSVSFTHPSNYTDGEFTAYIPIDNSSIKTTSQLRTEYQAAKGLSKPSSAQQAVKAGLTEEQYVQGQGTPVFSGGSEITKVWSNERMGGFGTIYRGRNELGGGIYITDSPEYAKTFGSQVTESSLKSNLRLLDVRESAKAIGNTELNRIKKGFDPYESYLKNGGKELLPTDYPDEILNKIQEVYGGNSTDIFKKAGFDGIVGEESRIGGQGGTVWNIFDESALKTTSQLRAEYQAALKAK